MAGNIFTSMDFLFLLTATEAPTSELNIRQSVYVAIVLITIYIVFFIIIMHFNLICITQG